MTVHWADPPPIGGPQDPRSIWMERLRPLVRNPGQWAIIRSGTPSAMYQAANIFRLRQVHVPPGDWEFTVRTFRRGVHIGDMNTANLYARYVGPWDEDRRLPYLIAQDAAFDEEGRRVCPECGLPLAYPGTGKWPKKCDDCWAKVPSRWARMRITHKWHGGKLVPR